jgi:hypothetical protein
MVALTVAEPAVVSLTVHDHVQLDRLTRTDAERYGDLVPRCSGRMPRQAGSARPSRARPRASARADCSC